MGKGKKKKHKRVSSGMFSSSKKVHVREKAQPLGLLHLPWSWGGKGKDFFYAVREKRENDWGKKNRQSFAVLCAGNAKGDEVADEIVPGCLLERRKKLRSKKNGRCGRSTTSCAECWKKAKRRAVYPLTFQTGGKRKKKTLKRGGLTSPPTIINLITRKKRKGPGPRHSSRGENTGKGLV